MIIGIYHNLSQQRAFSMQAAPDIEEEEREFSKVAFTALTNLLRVLGAEKDVDTAIEARKALDTSTTALSTDAVQVSPAKAESERLESRWTRARLALEILGEVLAEVDGIFDPALLTNGDDSGGDAEWTGIEASEMQEEEEGQPEMSAAHPNGHASNGQQPQVIAQDVRSVLRDLPALLVKLARPTKISYAVPHDPQSVKIEAASSDLIPTQANGTAAASSMQTEEVSASSTITTPNLPIFTDLFSYVHVRSLECLNNLFITLARSSSEGDESGDVKAAGNAAEDDLGPEVSIADDMANVTGGDHGDMDESDEGSDDEEGSTSSVTLEDMAANEGQESVTAAAAVPQVAIAGSQATWESLFNLLLQLHQQRPASKSAAKGAKEVTETTHLAIEAICGSIWALARYAGEDLVSAYTYWKNTW